MVARDVAEDIDSQYVMSYRPVPPWSNSKTSEYRSIDVLSRRADLTVKARRGYVVNPLWTTKRCFLCLLWLARALPTKGG
jgi:hypothetical protein